jgi:class 3 adenylate cyclase
VNIASRVQGLAASRSIVVTESVVENAHTRALLETNGLTSTRRSVALSGVAEKVSVYEIS